MLQNAGKAEFCRWHCAKEAFEIGFKKVKSGGGAGCVFNNRSLQPTTHIKIQLLTLAVKSKGSIPRSSLGFVVEEI